MPRRNHKKGRKQQSKRRKHGLVAWFLLSAAGSHVVSLRLLDLLGR